ncbi:MAG: hypothetical protein H6811_01680 [Phycisphaeraceae bacterium]|nr:hypothetical protein [Phycisphaeraceae bacterium]
MFKRLFGKRASASPAAESAAEHAVLLHVRMAEASPSKAERELVFGLEDRLASAIDAAGAGEFDGDEWGEGEAVLYMYGPDADRLWASIEGLVRGAGLAGGSYAIKRYGGPEARGERVDVA